MESIGHFATGIFATADDGTGELLGSHCPTCDRRAFPRRDYCPQCGREMADCGLGGSGTLYSYTVVRVRPPLGLPAPYGVGYVDLDSGPRVFGLLDPQALEALEIGQRLRLRVAPLGIDVRGNPCLRPYFTPRGEH